MDNKIVYVTNMANHKVGIKMPDLNLKVVWEKRGARKPIPEEKLQMAMYDAGVEYMFNQGILVIEDKEVEKELNIEEVALTDKQMENLWKNATSVDFRIRVKELPYEQIKLLANWAIENNIMDLDKAKIIKELIGTDIITKVTFKHGDE